MSTSAKLNSDKVVNKRATDLFDLLIFEQGLRAKHVIADKELNSLVVQLNNGMVLKVALDSYERLGGPTNNNWTTGTVPLEAQKCTCYGVNVSRCVIQGAFDVRNEGFTTC